MNRLDMIRETSYGPLSERQSAPSMQTYEICTRVAAAALRELDAGSFPLRGRRQAWQLTVLLSGCRPHRLSQRGPGSLLCGARQAG